MRKIVIIALLFVCGSCAIAKDITVNSIAALQTAINEAKAGDVISVADGVYTTDTDIVVKAVGTETKPITIAAAHTGMAEITGKSGFLVSSPSAYVIIKGFKFTHQASKAKTASGTSFCRFTENIFETPGNGENLTIAGSDHQIDFNTFQNKNAMGRFLAIRGAGSQIAERLWIHHNYFKSHKDQGGPNGAEAFQFGLSGFSLSSSNSIVESNLFEDCAGENELISVKASAVILRNNTIRNCPAQFTLRHGNKCEVYGNFFINTPGLRIFGDDHVIHSNYFEDCNPAITIGNGGAEVADGAPLTSHDRPDRVLIAFNTLVNNKTNIVQTPRKDGLGSTYVTVAANVIQGGGPAATISGPNTNATWTKNMIFNTNGAGDLPATGFVTADPKLVKDEYGIYHLQKGSPAIGAAEFNPLVESDLDGQIRTKKTDIGADQFYTHKYLTTILQPKDVGVEGVKNRGGWKAVKMVE
jgi:poly(beta-D-mannuronate) lyase